VHELRVTRTPPDGRRCARDPAKSFEQGDLVGTAAGAFGAPILGPGDPNSLSKEDPYIAIEKDPPGSLPGD